VGYTFWPHLKVYFFNHFSISFFTTELHFSKTKKLRRRQDPEPLRSLFFASPRLCEKTKKIPFKIFYEGDYEVGPLGIEPSTYCPEASGESVAQLLVFLKMICK